jgi:hypothetical protein
VEVTLAAIDQLKDSPALSAPVSPATRWEEIGRLSMSLFDLRGTYEANLRTLTCMQRSLERVRRVDGLPCEADLLLGEIARHIQALDAARTELGESLLKAARCLDGVLGTEARSAPQE